MTTTRKWIFWAILLLLTLASVEGLSIVGLAQLAGGIGGKAHVYHPVDKLTDSHREIIGRLLAGDLAYIQFSPALGWTVKPGGMSPVFTPKGRAPYRYRANNQGIRSDSQYTRDPPNGIVRIATFGDSFTHGDDVGNNDTWQRSIEKLDGRFEALNFGVGGFGLDQAFLRYCNDATGFRPHLVIIGFMPENIRRNVNVFRPFYYPESKIPLTKPRFTIEAGQLSLIENPLQSLADYRELLDNPGPVLRRIGINDDLYKIRYKSSPLDVLASVRLLKLAVDKFSRKYIGDGIIDGGVYNASSDAFHITVEIFRRFYSTVQDNGSVPVIVILPSRNDLNMLLATGQRRYQPLLGEFANRGYRYLDMLDVLAAGLGKEYEFKDLFVGHYSPMANMMVAGALLDFFRENSLLENMPAWSEQ